MCLKTVDEKVTVPDEGIGYKAMSQVSKTSPRFSSPYYSLVGKRTFAQTTAGLGRWLKSRQVREEVDGVSYQQYMTGFHIHTTIADSVKWAEGRSPNTIVAVAYRGVLHTGLDIDGNPNIVAKEIKILKVAKVLC